MRERSRKPEDSNEIAARIVRQATGEDEPPDLDDDAVRQAARALGRRGGLKGGPARAKKLSKKRRSEIAKKAAEKRWKDRKK